MGFPVEVVDTVTVVTDWWAVCFTVLVGGAISGAVSFGTVYLTLRGSRTNAQRQENRTILHKWYLQMETTRQILRGVKPEEELEKVHSSFRELWLSTAPEHDSPAWYIAMAFEVEMKTLREVDPQVSTYYQAREKHSEAVLRYQRAYSGPNPDYTETIGKMEAAQKDQMKYRAIADDVKDGALGVEWRALHGRATELANVSWGWLTGYSSKDVDAKYRRQLGYEISVAENRIRRRISDVAETTHSLVSKS